MICRHALGAVTDNDGNIHYKRDDIDGVYLVDVFNFCPDCGANLRCDHTFRAIKTFNASWMCYTYKAQCIKCGFVPD